MKSKNTNLHNAKSAKNDEFYTMLSDIENELKYYREQFKNKVIYCNCDDARKSNFFKYFSLNFEFLGLKKLITTSYNKDGNGSILIYEGDKNGNHRVDDEEIQVKQLQESGDFRSNECIELLKEADIIVTNPPFSLFREYFKQLIEYNKKFIVIGNKNAITYKEIFPYIKDGKLWLGKTIANDFILPNGNKTESIKGLCRWFTNLETNKYIDKPTLYKTYTEEEYPKYDNYDAINVNKVAEIPYDYDGAIGVPITIIDKVCSDGLIHFDTPMLDSNDTKYKILNLDRYIEDNPKYGHRFTINGKETYARVLIKKVNE